MKKYFELTDSESTLGVFEYTNNKEANSLIMQIICEHYCADDCELDKSFKIEEFRFRPLKITGSHWEDAPAEHEEAGDKNEFDLYINQVCVYHKEEKLFPNGFESWHETHYEIVQAIVRSEDIEGSIANKHAANFGTGGMYDLAKELTNEFEKLHKGKQWGIDDDTVFFDAIEEFLDKNL